MLSESVRWTGASDTRSVSVFLGSECEPYSHAALTPFYSALVLLVLLVGKQQSSADADRRRPPAAWWSFAAIWMLPTLLPVKRACLWGMLKF